MLPERAYCLVAIEPAITVEHGYGEPNGDIHEFSVIAVDESRERLERLKTALEKQSRFESTKYEIRETIVGDYIDYEYYRAVNGKYCFGDLPEEYKWNK